MTLAERFNSKVQRGDGCWQWLASRDSDGYGLLSVEGIVIRAHRVSWNLHHGEIPADVCVLHRCDTPGCVNPAHLFLGTRADNNADKTAKGRTHRPTGHSNPKAKLAPEQVVAIRADPRVQSVIAREYGVAQSVISRVKHGVLWAQTP